MKGRSKKSKQNMDILKFMDLLHDQEANLPVFILKIPDIEEIVRKRGRGGLINIMISKGAHFESTYGWQYFDDLVKVLTGYIIDNRENLLGSSAIVAKKIVRGSGFIIFLGECSPEVLRKKSLRIKNELQNIINEKFKSLNLGQVEILTGYAELIYDPMMRMERIIERAIERSVYNLIQEARNFADYSVLEKIIKEENVGISFQPIIRLENKEVVGHEALLRIKNSFVYDSPALFIEIARKSGLLLDLERLVYISALSQFTPTSPQSLLFINTTVYFLNYFSDFEEEFRFLMGENGIDENRLVLEITEKFSIESVEKFKDKIVKLKEKGYKISIDDVGTGYSTLEVLTEFEPDFLKYDRTLIKNIHRSNIKQELFKSIKSFSESIGAHLIAEGVESKEELQFLKEQGIELVQGFYFAKPSPILIENLGSVNEN